jgi:hypothetical protein
MRRGAAWCGDGSCAVATERCVHVCVRAYVHHKKTTLWWRVVVVDVIVQGRLMEACTPCSGKEHRCTVHRPRATHGGEGAGAGEGEGAGQQGGSRARGAAQGTWPCRQSALGAGPSPQPRESTASSTYRATGAPRPPTTSCRDATRNTRGGGGGGGESLSMRRRRSTRTHIHPATPPRTRIRASTGHAPTHPPTHARTHACTLVHTDTRTRTWWTTPKAMCLCVYARVYMSVSMCTHLVDHAEGSL